jgi:uncharacterized membrane protein
VSQGEINTLMLKKSKCKPFPYKDNSLIGIEVEVEGVYKSVGVCPLMNFYLWANIEDGSLRNAGREFVSLPLKGNQIPFAIDTLYATLNKDKKCLGHDFSSRTSTHIHMDFKDDSYETLANMLLLYFFVEPLLYKYVGGDRDKNIFCVPLNDCSKIKLFHDLFKSLEQNGNISNYSNQWSKYTGLNLLPLHNLGTIEFRHLTGCVDKTKVLNWIDILLSMKLYASNTSYQVLKKHILDMNGTSQYSALLAEIFTTNFDLLDSPFKDSLLEESVMFIKEIFSYSEIDYAVLFPKVKDILVTPLIKRGLEMNIIIYKTTESPKPVVKNYQEWLVNNPVGPTGDTLVERDDF